ncbi:unnamed protein product [Anisakis simplex]|uniref:CCR4-NOT transcription complex subunit 3 (inferred by orthology to a human protein) n=1 Tax=Anisakis simplex TaxID=6269 RepID=A0A0M3K2D7_ANISI|nr:unnamed protein product [Anisakis simplex]
MAEKRKLLNEIDKCFKKDDLKKEIKKLQRLRDQIKGWQNSSDIKDKDRLTHYRKLIEQRMEQFKDIERENKTKPHSKQGLSAEEKLDPREKEKADTVEWLQCQIRFLEDESDKTESQIESISTTEQTRKKGKRDDPKKGEKEKLKKLEDLRKHLERMKFHASKLEICMRLVNNETLESKKVMETLKEQFELYIDALDPDSENDAESFDPEASGVYDELDLQSYTPQLGGAIFGANEMDEKVDNNGDSKSSSSVSPTPVLPKELEDNSTKQRHLSGEATVTLSRQISSTRSTPATPLKLTNQVSVEGSSLNSPPPPATPPPPPGIPYSVAAGLGTKSGKGAVIQTLVKQPVDVVRQPSGVISVTTTTTTTASVAQQSAAAQQQQSAPQQITANDNDSTTSTPLHIDMPPPLSSQPAALSPVIVPASGSSTPESNLVKRFSASSSTSSQQENWQVMPMKGVAMSSSSTQGGGAPADVVPSSALSLTSSSAIGSRAQLLAAKALKKLSWRFHTKYLMWFQRHEEPKQITDDYEQGTYVYFDFEKWSQRKKEQFTFEYRYLEDKDFD